MEERHWWAVSVKVLQTSGRAALLEPANGKDNAEWVPLSGLRAEDGRTVLDCAAGAILSVWVERTIAEKAGWVR